MVEVVMVCYMGLCLGLVVGEFSVGCVVELGLVEGRWRVTGLQD